MIINFWHPRRPQEGPRPLPEDSCSMVCWPLLCKHDSYRFCLGGTGCFRPRFVQGGFEGPLFVNAWCCMELHGSLSYVGGGQGGVRSVNMHLFLACICAYFPIVVLVPLNSTFHDSCTESVMMSDARLKDHIGSCGVSRTR